MKPWLLNILACPIDKHHPLEAYFFNWETKEEEIKKITSEAAKPNKHFAKSYKHLSKQIFDSTISFPSIEIIIDKTPSENSKKLLALTIDSLVKIKHSLIDDEKALFRNLSEEIDVIYRYLNLIELDSGILVCPECGRWYPIGSAVETIPEMLPDDLREKDKDIEWMQKWSELIPSEIIKNGKPFNLS
jgi:uncharacterized protein YbaR (Trm112 family)